MPLRESEHGIIFEYIVQGRYVKVIAVCTRTGFEVSIVGDAKEPRSVLQRIASQKLLRMIEQKKPQPLSGGRGILA